MPLKFLIFSTIGVSLFAAAFPELQQWLSLSESGIEHLYLWQFITYVFVEPGPFSFSFFLQLAFNMYILWAFGSSLIERSHPRLFFVLYFGSSLTSGLVALAFPHSSLAGSTNPICALLVAWMMFNPGSRLLLFFTHSFKAYWLIAFIIGASLLIHISTGNWLEGATLAISVLFGYLFSLIAWRQQSPFPLLRPFERRFLRLLERKKGQQPYQRSKIYDIHSGQPILDDDQFMDAMLDQVSRHGEESLTVAEKKRMREISRRKK